MSTDSNDAWDIEPGQDWDVFLFQPEDAEGVSRLFRSVYGEGYAVRTYVEPAMLIAENAAHRVISSVAKTPGGEVVGHNALFNSAAHPGTYESGAGVVHQAYRGGKGIFTRMVDHGIEVARQFPHLNAVFCEPVCNHLFSQKLTDKAGFPPRALEVDLIPPSIHQEQDGRAGRVAAFLVFRTFRPRPHTVYLPAVYRDELDFLYQGLDDSRDFRISEQGIPARSVSEIRPQIFDFAQVARVAVHEVGEDFAPTLDRLEKELRGRSIHVNQIWVNLACPWSGQAVEILRDRGYFLGGPLPRWFDSDGLLMQKILKRPNWEEIQVLDDHYAEILRRIRADWERSIEAGRS
ncbi:GNAT family N-acetyltransferase [Desulfatiglans anilini]|uniref:GNAT family N-acetyltransferase n=1 Tax=Desulfatiglans anilini TaxID=90728 RepID=UPI0003FC88B0|nr:GNAT family N-acetyltransferase [Desulfatiglans anilini]